MKQFRTLELAKQFYKNSKKLKIRGEIKNQFERASLSIVLNLAEGSGKPSRKDRIKFYSIAYGSCKEVQAILDLIDDQCYVNQADMIGAMIYKLIQNPGSA